MRFQSCPSAWSSFPRLVLLGALGAAPFLGCSNQGGAEGDGLTPGQSEFESAPPSGSGRGLEAPGVADGGGVAAGEDAGDSSGSGDKSATREVEETDLYRLEGDRLYYLNAYRGLMVFDVTNVDRPVLLGRSPIYGSPVEMIVRDGIADVVVADWYGQMDDGTPFHGSIVRGIDATDPTDMKILGEARLGGWVRDTRVVGDVLYAVTEKYSWDYGWYERGAAGGVASSSGAQVSVTSVNFGSGAVETVDAYDVPGYGGVFHVTANAILLASDIYTNVDGNGFGSPTGQSELRYLDISDPAGKITPRGRAVVEGSIQSWGADNGRWNLDFADGVYAHVVSRTDDYSGGTSHLHVATVDFTKPSAPVVTGELDTVAPGWDAAARFDSGRLYLTPTSWGCNYEGDTVTGSVETPLDVYDVSDPAAPEKIGSATISGQVSLMIPSGDRLFALGSNYDCTDGRASPLALSYFDVSDPTKPLSLGSAEFGKGWAWTPAAGTFKAFIKDDAQGLVVLPFSGWDYEDYTYQNGVQLIEFSDTTINSSGTAHTKGWVERGIFVKDRIVSLSDLSLSVVDYSDHANPEVIAELVLARNVVNARPVGDNIVEVSSDFWDNDNDHSELRVLPASQAEENVSGVALSSLSLRGTNPTVFHNGNTSYVVSNVREAVDCADSSKGAPEPDGGAGTCYAWTQEVQAVDVTDGQARALGRIALPNLGNGYWGGWGWGWYGCMVDSWYYGADVVQVAGDKLAFRRWSPQYDGSGNYVDALESLFVVDLADPSAPELGSTIVTRDPNGWWGNMRSIGDQLYASHYEWIEEPAYDDASGYRPGRVKYYLDRVDVSDPKQPKITHKINVPGILVGGSESDPSLIYTMDYRWTGEATVNDLAVLRVEGDKAFLQGHLSIPGYTGNVFVRGDTAYFSVETYSASTSEVSLYQVDLSDPRSPEILPSPKTKGWGWLLGVEGDRAFVTSGWGQIGIDVFQLSEKEAPRFDQFIRTRGYWQSSLARKGNDVFLASGYWGTQVVKLK